MGDDVKAAAAFGSVVMNEWYKKLLLFCIKIKKIDKKNCSLIAPTLSFRA